MWLNYDIAIDNFKKVLSHGLVLRKVDRIINFNTKAKQKMTLKKIFLSWWITQFLQKLWRMGENIAIESCHNRNTKQLFSIKTKLSCCKVFHRASISNRNEEKADTYE